MLCQEVIEVLQKLSPEHCACSWDNVGLLVGGREQEVERVYIALDANEAAIAQAERVGADLLLTHHPMLFQGIKRIDTEDFIGKRIIRLIQSKISCYAMHTNFDIKVMGQLAADRMGLKERQTLDVVYGEGEEAEGIGKVGLLPEESTVSGCADLVKEAFGLDSVRVYGPMQQPVKRVAVCPGSGKSVIGKAIKAGAQVLVTGDIGHHEGMDAAAQGLFIIDAGHYGVEKIFVPYMVGYLQQNAAGLQVIGEEDAPPFVDW